MGSLPVKLEKLRKIKLNALQKGLLKAGLALQGMSQQIVPVEHGVLKSSASTVLIETNEAQSRVSVKYSAPYALVVHENPNAAHGADYNKKHADRIATGKDFARGVNQCYKFLERPLRENAAELKSIVMDEVNSVYV